MLMRNNNMGKVIPSKRIVNIKSLILAREKALARMLEEREYYVREERNLKLILLLEI